MTNDKNNDEINDIVRFLASLLLGHAHREEIYFRNGGCLSMCLSDGEETLQSNCFKNF